MAGIRTEAVLTGSEDILPQLVKPAQEDIYAHKAKQTEDISIAVNTRM